MTLFQRLTISLMVLTLCVGFLPAPGWVIKSLCIVLFVVIIFFVRELIKFNQQSQPPEYKPKIIGVKEKK